MSTPCQSSSAVPLPWALLEMRARLRLVDIQLMALLSQRFEILHEIQAYKRDAALPLRDAERESEVLAYCLDLAADLNVPAAIVHALYRELFEAARGGT